MKKESIKVTVSGRQYDMGDLADATAIQAVLVPDNWKAGKADCVRLMLSMQEMLAFQLKKHLAHNWNRMCKTIRENIEESAKDGATLGVTFKFTMDQSVPTVAAIRDHAMSFSAKYGSTGRPQTHDIAQGDFFGDLSATVDPGALEAEAIAEDAAEEAMKADAKETARQQAEEDERKAAAAAEPPAIQPDGEKKALAKRKRKAKE
jgi:hypothetical protein